MPALANNDFLLCASSCRHKDTDQGQVVFRDDDRLIFLIENQGCWRCLTSTEGDDPPVWKLSNWNNNERRWMTDEIVCESLSRFLVTFVLHELASGSRCSLLDTGLDSLFEEQLKFVKPVWLKGPYAFGAQEQSTFHLWENVLVVGGLDEFRHQYSAHDDTGVAFLLNHQSPMDGLDVCFPTKLAAQSCSIEIEPDGSAKAQYSEWPIREESGAPAGTFDFNAVRDQLLNVPKIEHYPENHPYVRFRRSGQPGTRGEWFADIELAKSLFRQAALAPPVPNAALLEYFDSLMANL